MKTHALIRPSALKVKKPPLSRALAEQKSKRGPCSRYFVFQLRIRRTPKAAPNSASSNAGR